MELRKVKDFEGHGIGRYKRVDREERRRSGQVALR